MTCLELFSGCGGLAKGLELAGFEHRAFVEFNKWACESLRENFEQSLVHETDVRKFDFRSVGEVDIVAGGPPCQPFSLGGLARAHEDARDMFPEAIRAIQELRPKGFLFENVKGLLRKSFADYFSYIILRLSLPDCAISQGATWREHLEVLRKINPANYSGLKYDVQYKMVNAVDYGVPQNRERVFIVGLRSDVKAEWAWPLPVPGKRSIADTIGHLVAAKKDSLPSDHVMISGAREYPGHSGSAYNLPSKTIKAGAHGVPGGENMIRFPDGRLRYMTVHEAKLIQTFPADYKISGSWGEAMRQIGNAVPVRLAEKMGRCMISALLSDKDATKSNVGRIVAYRHAPVQLRLAIERKNGYKGKGPKKGVVKPKRPKSLKARYARKAGDGKVK